MIHEVLDKLSAAVGTDNIKGNEPMCDHTSFRIGGPAEVFVTPSDEEQLAACVRICRTYQIPVCLIGNGSNLLVGDQGIEGIVIQTRKMNTVEVDGEHIYAQCGASLGAAARAAQAASLTGLEFASGIPGTIGGAVVMNAGAYGGEMKDVITSVRVLTPDGSIEELDAQQMAFGYRTSAAAKRRLVVLSVTMQLAGGVMEEISAKMNELNGRRRDKQPLDKPSAGSTFKRPEGYFAGKLIMDAGLAGYKVGGAAVSAKHCGFVVNEGAATAADVRQLIMDVQRVVEERYGVRLEPEVKMIGKF